MTDQNPMAELLKIADELEIYDHSGTIDDLIERVEEAMAACPHDDPGFLASEARFNNTGDGLPF